MKNPVAIVGWGETALGVVPGVTPLELTVQASLAALKDVGLQPSRRGRISQL